MLPEKICFRTNVLLKIALSPPGAFFIGGIAVLLFRQWPTDNAAAWVQAFGSISAIVAAFMVANNAHRRQIEAARKASQESEARAAHLAECAAYEAVCALYRRAKEWDPMTAKKHSTARLAESRRVLRNTLAQPLPNNIVSSIFRIQEELSETIVMVEEWGPLGPNQDQVQLLKKRARTAEIFYKTIQKEYLDISNRAGIAATVRANI